MYHKNIKTKLIQIAVSKKIHATRYTLHARGFTLVETLVAVFIMMIAIIAPMSIASQALSTARYAKEQVTAFYLAQEGIELVRDIRDNIVLANNAGVKWNEGGVLGRSESGDTTICYSSNGCQIDAKDLAVTACVAGCAPLNVDNNGIYSYSDVNKSYTSQYTRTIKITKISDDEISVASTVSWLSNVVGGASSFTITDNLTHWQ